MPKYAYKSDVLFLVKKRDMVSTNPGDWNYIYSHTSSSGLLNSVQFINGMLTGNGLNSNLVQCTDNNDIDREVTKYRPKVVFIEALWVVPEKFDILTKLHPDVKWVIRLHSEIPFLANEGMAMGWLFKYAKKYPNVLISANSQRVVDEMSGLLGVPILHTPNYYPVSSIQLSSRARDRGVINISCFGAIRPLKNHLTQAIAALNFANRLGKKLRFHINGSRKESNGTSAYKNVVELFEAQPHHELVQHAWMPHDVFKHTIRKEIDIGMQVSFTETYNIVMADHIDQGIPVVSSDEVKFVSGLFIADPTEVDDIENKLYRAYVAPYFGLQHINFFKLRSNSYDAENEWLSLLSSML